jgi:hypothetical protein
MTLSNTKFLFIFVFLCAYSGVFVFEKLSIWVFASLCAFVLITLEAFKKKRIPVNTVFLVFVISLVVDTVINLENIKIGTFLYSISLAGMFLFTEQRIKKCETELILKTYSYILFSFFLLIVLGLLLYFVLGVADFSLTGVDMSRSIPRCFGPSTEPSYAALTLSITMMVLFSSSTYSYLFIRFSLLIYFLCIILIGSGFGFISSVLVLGYFFLKSNVKILAVEKILLGVCILGIFPFLSFEIERLKPLLVVIIDLFQHGSLWLAFDAIKNTDASAWFRFGPLVEFIRDINTLDVENIIFGHGAGNSTHYFGAKYEAHLNPDWFDSNGLPTMDLPFLPAFIYDYGVLPSLICLSFINSRIRKLKGSLIFWCLTLFILFNSNFNTNIFWFLMYSLLAIRIIQSRVSSCEKN